MKRLIFLIISSILFLSSCTDVNSEQPAGEGLINYNEDELQTATLAGGCFWCIEAPFEKVEGVARAVSGYAGGKEDNPTYKQVSGGATSHVEAVQVFYDPSIISYSEILDVFWKLYDPTDEGGSFYDRGSQYTSAIFYHNDSQKETAAASKVKLNNSGIFNNPVVTPVKPFTTFFDAEEYHQDFYKKDPNRYYSYRAGSGRDNFIEKTWGNLVKNEYEKPEEEEIKSKLTPLQFRVTQEDGTERAFDNEYWDNKKQGIYVDIVTGQPLFSSKDKYDSKTGWPSFTKPIDPRKIVKKTDTSQFMKRVEARSKLGDSHLGHVFNDGPEPTNLRYCINSASLKFIPREEMGKMGYDDYLWLFK